LNECIAPLPCTALTIEAPAKINLFLRVIGRRADGYHLIETCMQKVCLYDTVKLISCAAGIHVRCSGAVVPEGRDNLVFRAAELFFQATQARRRVLDAGVRIELTKRIPIAAGLGGGSSDAAATLRGLNTLYACGCSAEELAAIGLRLGADVPFFLSSAPAALATGIGELLQPIEPLRGYSVLLVNPGFPVSTRWVYQTFALTEKENTSILKNSQEDVSDRKILTQPFLCTTAWDNDLEAITVGKYPEIGWLKDELVHAGARHALMSGSGPTFFGLFAERHVAEACCVALTHRFPHTYLLAPVTEPTL
jgi:4-diphosphocytidyl-2-C-methyl-D-erythritol kinase